MTTAELKEKVIGFIHGKDGKGDWILPWQHMGANCIPCDELTAFIEGIFNRYGVTPKPSELTKTPVTIVIDSRPFDKWKHFKFKGWDSGPTFCLREDKSGPLFVVDDETHKCK